MAKKKRKNQFNAYKAKNHSWQRDPNPTNLIKTPYIAYPPFSIFFVKTLTCTLKKVTLFFSSKLPLKTENLSFYKNPPPFWKSGRRLNLPPPPSRKDGGGCSLWVYWGLTSNVVFCWYSDLISHKRTHTLRRKGTRHNQGPVD